MAKLLLILPAVALAACAPIYVPASVHVPLLHEAGDVHLSGNLGTHGVQAQGSVAITDAIAARGAVQEFGYAGGSDGLSAAFVSGGGGVSFFYGGEKSEDGTFRSGVRASGSIELHGGRSAGVGHVRVTIPSTVSRYSGAFLRPVLQADVAYAWPYLAVGAAARFSLFQYWYDAQSDFSGAEMQLGTVEPVLFVRFGAESVKLDLQAGLAGPVSARGEATVPFPLLISAGLVVDL